MCEPTTLLAIGTAVSATGTIVSGVSQAQQQRYQAAVADRNAMLANQSAADAIQRGKLADQQSQQRTSQLLGQQRAAMAANGIEVDFGSAADIQADTKMIGAQEAQTVRDNAMREASGYEIEAANFGSEAVSQRSAATASLVNAGFGATSTILGGAQQYRKLQAAKAGG